MREAGYKTIMINCNPETVSTDFDLVDRLYFEPVTLENVLDIVEFEQPDGVLVQFGGQTPLKIARELEAAGVPIIGTSPESIDLAEDRAKFGAILDRLGINRPNYGIGHNMEQIVDVAQEVGYPVLVRPSYVLGGRAMEIVYDTTQLADYLSRSVDVISGQPVLIDEFLEDAFEFDVDAICDGEELVIGGIMQHIEEAGIHSGNSACVLPPYMVSAGALEEIISVTKKLALELGVVGLINLQFAYKDDQIFILEVNPRASRTVPFVSKATNIPLAKLAAKLAVGMKLKDFDIPDWDASNHIAVKEVVVPFNKFPDEPLFLGPEMKSTGEVMGISEQFGDAYRRAVLGAGKKLPTAGTVFISVNDRDKLSVIPVARDFQELGFSIVATAGTARARRRNGVPAQVIIKVGEGRPNVLDLRKSDEVQLIINTPLGQQARKDEGAMGKAGIQKGIPVVTTMSAAQAMVRAIRSRRKLTVSALQDIYPNGA